MPVSPNALCIVACCFASLVTACCGDREGEVMCVDRAERPAPVFAEIPAVTRPADRLPQGWKVNVVGVEGSWSRVRFRSPVGEASSAGWIRTKFLGSCNAVRELHSKRVEDRPMMCWWRMGPLGGGAGSWDPVVKALDGCDVLGIAEVRTKNAPAELAKQLGRSWSSLVSEVGPGSNTEAEALAILYDREVFTLAMEDERGAVGRYREHSEEFRSQPWAVPLRSDRGVVTPVLFQFRDTSLDKGAPNHRLLVDVASWFEKSLGEARGTILAGGLGEGAKPTERAFERLREAGWRPLFDEDELGDAIFLRGVDDRPSPDDFGFRCLDENAVDSENGEGQVARRCVLWVRLSASSYQR
jgi:hypothetical protein